jgi:hypothetical protein
LGNIFIASEPLLYRYCLAVEAFGKELKSAFLRKSTPECIGKGYLIVALPAKRLNKPEDAAILFGNRSGIERVITNLARSNRGRAKLSEGSHLI